MVVQPVRETLGLTRGIENVRRLFLDTFGVRAGDASGAFLDRGLARQVQVVQSTRGRMSKSSLSHAVQDLDGQSFADSIRHGVTLVCFSEPWCGVCGLERPILERVAVKVANCARVASMDVDEAPDLAAHFNIEALPTLVLFKDGEAVRTFVGVNSEPVLTRAILSVLEAPLSALD
jgi:thioredoxin 1